jgi:PAS domain S-box-containing protein
MKGKKWGTAPFGLGALLAVLLAVGVAALWGMHQLKVAWHWEKHTYQVLGELEALLSGLTDLETAERGYAISGDPSFFEPFNRALPTIEARVEKVRRLTADNAGQQRRLDGLGPLIRQRIAEAGQVIAARANVDGQAARARVAGGDGKRLVDALRGVIAQMEAEERRLLSERGRAATASVRRQQGTLVAGSALGVGIVATALLLMDREGRHRRRAEAAQRRTLDVLNATHDGVFMCDARTLRFFYVNEGAVRLVGYAREELLGMGPQDLNPAFDEPGYRARIAPLLEGGQGPQALSAVYRRKGGGEVPVEIVLQATETAAGERALVAIVRDVTERKRAEGALQQSFEKLKALEAQRDSLTGMIIHDLRSPLTVTIGYLELLNAGAEDRGDAEALGHIALAQQGAQTLNALIGSLLDVTRLEAGQMPLQCTACDLGELARAVLTPLAALADGRRLTLEVPAAAPVRARCDAELTRRVIANLVQNALKFTPPPGQVRVAIAACGPAARLSVTDRGPGIAREHHRKIFEKFGQVGGSQTVHSSGLGLTFCKLALEAQGGSIGLESEVGQGSRFWFLLPAA